MNDETGVGISVSDGHSHGGGKGHGPRKPRRRGRRGRRKLPPMSIMPTMVTLGNLVAGFAAIYYAALPLKTTGPWGWSTLTVAGTLIFIGMLLDAIDGSVARLTNSISDIGAQLDSLADLVTFGVAPAFMMLRLVSYYVGPEGSAAGELLGPEADLAAGKAIWGVAAIYLCCAALRLARFNVETPSAAAEHHMIFRGLPSPGAAGTVASLIVVHQHWLHQGMTNSDDVLTSLTFARWSAFGIPFITLFCALAMVSSIPYVHVMNRYVSGRRSFAYAARLIIPVFLSLLLFHHETLAICFTGYALYSPLRGLPSWLRNRRAATTSAS